MSLVPFLFVNKLFQFTQYSYIVFFRTVAVKSFVQLSLLLIMAPRYTAILKIRVSIVPVSVKADDDRLSQTNLMK